MMYPQKNQIAKTFNTVFNDEAIKQYLSHSHYRLKHTWVEGITSLGELRRYLSPLSHITVIQRENFSALCLCQLEYCRRHTGNERILKYFNLMAAFFSANALPEAAKLKDMINRLEVKIINSLEKDNASKTDIVNFLKIAMLFGDKMYIYDQQTKKSLEGLCAFVA